MRYAQQGKCGQEEESCCSLLPKGKTKAEEKTTFTNNKDTLLNDDSYKEHLMEIFHDPLNKSTIETSTLLLTYIVNY